METSKIYNNDYEKVVKNTTTENNVTSSFSTNTASFSKEDFLEGFIQELANFILYELTFRQILKDLTTREERVKYLNERKNKLFECSISVSKNTDFYNNYIKHLLNFIKYNTARKNLAACENPYLNADLSYLITSSSYLTNAEYVMKKFNIINIYCNSYGTVTVKFSFNLSRGIMLILNSLDIFVCDRDCYFKNSPITLKELKRYKLECIIDKLKKEGIKK